MQRSGRRRLRPRLVAAGLVVAAAGLSAGVGLALAHGHRIERTGQVRPPSPRRRPGVVARLSPLRARIVAIAESQVGYRTNPPSTYCNKYSAYWVAGAADCASTSLRNEEWCADFAAWVWQRAGARVVYQFINGDLNSSSESFYEWGVRMHTWHPVGSGYVPKPGDVAVYGLRMSPLYAAHVAVVVGFTPGDRGPTAVNGDGNITGFSVVEERTDEYRADVPGKGALLSGYVSPSPAEPHRSRQS